MSFVEIGNGRITTCCLPCALSVQNLSRWKGTPVTGDPLLWCAGVWFKIWKTWCVTLRSESHWYPASLRVSHHPFHVSIFWSLNLSEWATIPSSFLSPPVAVPQQTPHIWPMQHFNHPPPTKPLISESSDI